MPLPDAEVAMVDWVKADPVLSPMLGAPDPVRVATRFPINTLTTPFLRVIRIGGTRENAEAPIDNPLMQWDVLAAKLGGGPDFTLGSLIMRTLVERLETINSGGAVVTDGFIYGVQFVTGPRREDGPPDTEMARYLLETELWTR